MERCKRNNGMTDPGIDLSTLENESLPEFVILDAGEMGTRSRTIVLKSVLLGVCAGKGC
jgi:hypothetical protein